GFTFPGTSVIVGWDEFTTIVVALGLAFGTAAVLRWTTFGTSMRAVADDPEAARLWGINVNRVMAVSWVAGSAMGAIAGVLITPRINFDPISLTIVVIDAFTAALIGRLTSLPWTVVGAILFRPGARLVQRISAGREYAPVPATGNPPVRRAVVGAGIGLGILVPLLL